MWISEYLEALACLIVNLSRTSVCLLCALDLSETDYRGFSTAVNTNMCNITKLLKYCSNLSFNLFSLCTYFFIALDAQILDINRVLPVFDLCRCQLWSCYNRLFQFRFLSLLLGFTNNLCCTVLG